MNAASAICTVFLGGCIAVGPAYAQGRSDAASGKTKDKSAKTSTDARQPSRASESGIASPVTAASPTSSPAASANAVVYFGSWLDDASIVAPGDVWIGLATGFWQGDSNRQFDVPVGSAAIGVSRRLQVGGSMSYYHFRDPNGLTESGMGNVSAYGKYQLLDPMREPNAIGLAITPLVEISPGGGDPFGWAVPVNLETQRGNLRLYGSAGYFSRGSVFGTLGADIPVGPRMAISANVGQSYASAGARQTAFGIGASYGLTQTGGLYVGVGQTMIPSTLGPGGISFAGGLSFLLPQPQIP